MIAENNPSKAILDEDDLEASNESAEEGDDSGNEADSKPLEEEDEEYEIKPFINFNKIIVIDATNEANEWVINKNIKFAYAPTIASDSMSSHTRTEIDSLSELEILTIFYLPIWSSLLYWSKITSD